MSIKDFEEFKKATDQEKEQYVNYTEAQKNLADSEKSKSEAKEVKKHFTQKPSFYISLVSALIPSILAVIAFFGTNAREFFDNQARKAELDKKELDLKILELEKVKEKLQQDSLNLVEWHEQRKVELKAEYDGKKAELEEEYSNQITSLTTEIEGQNQTLESRLNDLQNSKMTIDELREDLVEALNTQKSQNEVITRLTNRNENLDQKISSLTLEVENKSNSEEELEEQIGDYRSRTLKNRILVYLLRQGWSRVGYNRIRKDIDPDARNTDIDEVIAKNQHLFSTIALKDPNDPKGLNLRDKLTVYELLQ